MEVKAAMLQTCVQFDHVGNFKKTSYIYCDITGDLRTYNIFLYTRCGVQRLLIKKHLQYYSLVADVSRPPSVKTKLNVFVVANDLFIPRRFCASRS